MNCQWNLCIIRLLDSTYVEYIAKNPDTDIPQFNGGNRKGDLYYVHTYVCMYTVYVGGAIIRTYVSKQVVCTYVACSLYKKVSV